MAFNFSRYDYHYKFRYTGSDGHRYTTPDTVEATRTQRISACQALSMNALLQCAYKLHFNYIRLAYK